MQYSTTVLHMSHEGLSTIHTFTGKECGLTYALNTIELDHHSHMIPKLCFAIAMHFGYV